MLTVGETRVNPKGYYVGPEFLTMFEFPIVKGGTAEKVLLEPTSIVITESLAKSLFGDQDPLNQIIRLDNKDELKVSAVLKNVPTNSSFEFEFLLPWSLYTSREWVIRNLDNWGNNSFQMYVELNDPSKEVETEAAIENLIMKNEKEKDFERKLFFSTPFTFVTR